MHYERPHSTRNYNMTINGKRPKFKHFWAGMYELTLFKIVESCVLRLLFDIYVI